MGCLNGLAVVRLRIPPFIATLGVLSIGRGIVLLITHGPVGAIAPGFRLLSRGSIGPVPSALIIILVVFGAAAVVMNRTRWGRYLFAMGGSREVSRLAGIRVSRIEFSSYLVSGLCAAFAGLYLSSRMGVGDPSVGPGFDLDSIIAVLVGGIPFGGRAGQHPGGHCRSAPHHRPGEPPQHVEPGDLVSPDRPGGHPPGRDIDHQAEGLSGTRTAWKEGCP